MELINILKTLNFEAIFDINQVTLEGTDDSSASLIRGEVKPALQKESEEVYINSSLYVNDDEEVYLRYSDWGILHNSGEVLRFRGSSNRGASICVRTILAIRGSGNSALAF